MRRSYPRGARLALAEFGPDLAHEHVELAPEDGAIARGLLHRHPGSRPRVGVVMLHPRMDQTQSYVLAPVARAGYAALGCAGRYVHNDSNAIQERLVLDVAAAVRSLRERGCEQVVLVGNSGGGGILALYQAQARTPPGARLADTPSGEPCDLGAWDLPPADGLVLFAAHPGEGSRLARWLDPAVVDESDPLRSDPTLDMYDPANGFRIPPEPSRYDPAFLARYVVAQRERLRRLDDRARALLADRASSEGRRAALPHHLLIHRVLACPEWLDPTLEPDDRDVTSFNNDPRPDLQNYEDSIATYLTPEAFLSTWSGLSSRADVHACLPHVPDPLLVVHYGGDVVTRTSEARAFVAASAADDKELVVVPRADHWGFTITGPHRRGDRSTAGTDALVAWLRSRFPLE